MGLHLYSVHHDDHGLDLVERVAHAVPGLGQRLVANHDGIGGAVVLSTCNRVEVYVDAEGDPDQIAQHVLASFASEGEAAPSWTELPLRVRHGSDVLWHLFGVGAGLDSMVVGEREIAGQLRRALRQAHQEKTTTYLLTESIEQALRTSRKVAHLTNLAATGRSVVSVGLDLLQREWAPTRVLLMGTGAYAGAVVADLRDRGCSGIRVYSESGRAASFAASHDVAACDDDLSAELVDADVVVTCRGQGRPILREAHVSRAMEVRGGRPLAVVDLALARDVEPSVGEIEGVMLLDLAVIQRHVPDASAREVGRAQEMVASGVADLMTTLTGRQMDPAVIALRDKVSEMVEDEIERMPRGRLITQEEAAHALRRLAARLIHVPSVRARKAALEGRQELYLAALTELYGIHAEPQRLLPDTPTHPNLEVGETPRQEIEPDSLDGDTCPITGLSLTDLGQPVRREAM